MNSYNEHTDYKLTDLDYLTGDHHLQMMKAALPFLNVPQQRTLSMYIRILTVQNKKRSNALLQPLLTLNLIL